jgi:hypothetical protein
MISSDFPKLLLKYVQIDEEEELGSKIIKRSRVYRSKS